MHRLIAALAVLATAGTAQAHAPCAETAARPQADPRPLAVAAAARAEYAAFGGPVFGPTNQLLRTGATEAEHPATAPAPWQRVHGYWAAVPQTAHSPEPRAIRWGRGVRPADRTLLRQALQQASAARLQGLGVGPDEGLRPDELEAIATALDRVAVVDTPWSAAFISWLFREAGVPPSGFAFSDAHADYAAAALQPGGSAQVQAGGITPVQVGSSTQVLRACDGATTAPRVGDLLCQPRAESAGLNGFDALVDALRRRAAGSGQALPMHCDVVVAVDADGADTVGGNVADAVALRRVAFSGGVPAGWPLLLQWR